MSIFGSIMSKIFHHPAAAAAAPEPAAPVGGPPSPAAPGADPAGAAPQPQVDVDAVLTDMTSKSGRQLNWRTSIVDLMELLGLDHSLEQRKLLADELSYKGDANDSGSMNIWLHKQVMTQLAANGGKVPDDLKV